MSLILHQEYVDIVKPSTCSDGPCTLPSYIHYLLIRPRYHGKGIGKEQVRLTTEKYKDYLRIVVIAANEALGLCTHCGLKVGEGKTPLFITSLWT